MNINGSILDATGRELFGFGGTTAWRTHSFRGYLVSLEWFVGSRSTEPILMIQDEKAGFDAGALGICLSSIGKYVDERGSAAPGVMPHIWRALDTMGKPMLDIEARTLLDVIVRFAPDLIKMPPTPVAVRREEVRRPLLEVELKDENTGKTQQEVSI